MANVVSKITAAGNPNVLVTERGVSFGYNTLVSDMRALPILAKIGAPVIFDATHSVQQPGGQGTSSGGDELLFQCWRVPLRPSALPACSSRRIKILTPRLPMGRI